MPVARPLLPRLVNNAAALAVGVAGGAVFAALGTPIPWLLGPLFAVAAVNLAGWRVSCPTGGRQLGQVFIGTVIGLYFSPAIAAIVLAQLPWMVLVAVVSILMGGVAAVVLMRVSGVDGPTAFFGSVPGGMAEMITIGDRFRAESVPLTLAQTLRVTIVVLTIPAALTYFGETGSEMFTPAVRIVAAPGLALLLAGAGLVALALNRLGVTNAWMLGACGFAGALTAFRIELSAVPAPVLIAAQVLIAASLGERFEREAMGGAPRVLLGAAAGTAIMIAASLVLAAAIAAASGFSVSSMVAATAPGGLAEMSVTAQVLGLGVPLVTAYHVVRVFMITLFTLPLYRLATRLAASRR